MPTSEVTPVTIRYIRPLHHGQTSQYHGHEWMTHIIFVRCQSAVPPWIKGISDFDLEISTPRSRSWVWSKGKVIQSAQYHINSPLFHFILIRPIIPEIELFRYLTLKHPRWNILMSEVKGQGQILYPVSNRCTSFSFHINRTNHSWDMAKIVFDLEITHPRFLKKICQNHSLQNLIR